MYAESFAAWFFKVITPKTPKKLSKHSPVAVFKSIVTTPAGTLPLSLFFEDFWFKSYHTRLFSSLRNKTGLYKRYQLYGVTDFSEEFTFDDNSIIWYTWNHDSDRFCVTTYKTDYLDSFGNIPDRLTIETINNGRLYSDVIHHWASCIFYELAFDIVEIDYAPHGEIVLENELALTRPRFRYLNRLLDPKKIKFRRNLRRFCPIESQALRTYTHRRHMCRRRRYKRFKDGYKASDRACLKDVIYYDHGYGVAFTDFHAKKDSFGYIPRFGTYYHDYWWPSTDLMFDLAIDQTTEADIISTLKLEEEEIWHREVLLNVLCDPAWVDFQVPLMPKNTPIYTTLQSSSFILDPSARNVLRPNPKLDEDKTHAELLRDTLFRYDYYDRIEFLDNRVVELSDAIIDHYVFARDDV